MQIKQSVPKPMKGLMKLLILSLFLFPLISFGQTTYIPLGSEEYILLDRMEIKLGTDSVLNFSKTRPFSREAIIPVIQSFYEPHIYKYSKKEVPPDTTLAPEQEALFKVAKFSVVDGYNMRRALINSLEWTNDISAYKSKKPWGKIFYQTLLF